MTAQPLVAAPHDQPGSMKTGQVAFASIAFGGVRVIFWRSRPTPSGATWAAMPGAASLEVAARPDFFASFRPVFGSVTVAVDAAGFAESHMVGAGAVTTVR